MVTALSSLSVTDLEAELRRRQRRLPKLERTRQRLMSKLLEVEQEIAALGGAGRGKGIRPRNKQPLADVIAQVLGEAKQPMKVANIVMAVKQAGYRTTSNNFSTIVNQTLIKDKRFKSTERGFYALK
jgi:hypothetical protein